MALGDTVIRLTGKGNDLERRILRREGRTESLYFLKRAGETGVRWAVTHEPAAGWLVGWSEFRGQIRVSLATADEFDLVMAESTHLAWGVPVGGRLDVYGIEPDRRDVVPPTGDSPEWKVYAARDGGERFAVPEEEEE